VKDDVSEADDDVIAFGDDRAVLRAPRSEAVRPHRQAVRRDVAIEKVIRVRAPIMTAPAVDMERGDGLRVGTARRPQPDLIQVSHKPPPHRSWRWHRAEAGCRTVNGPGPSGHSG